MIPKPFDAIVKQDIEDLVDLARAERRTLEYKQALAVDKGEDRKEFLADVSSFANASGGDILYGVVDKRENGQPTGIPESAPGLSLPNPGATLLHLEQVLRGNIDPPVPGIQTRAIEGFPGGNVVVLIRVPKSYSAPHMAKQGDWGRFYSRTSNGKYILDVGEIRSAFALSESLPERIRRFRSERLAQILAGETPLPLRDGPKVVLHLLPLGALEPTRQVDVQLVSKQRGTMSPMYSSGCNHRYNFDGYLCYNTDNTTGVCNSYVQFFRSSAIEAVDARILINRDKGKLFPSPVVEDELLGAVRRYLEVYGVVQVQPPIVVMVSLLGVRDYYITGGMFNDVPATFDRDMLMLPDLLIQDSSVDVAGLFKPAFDSLWQASGWPKCWNYDEHGQRVNNQKYLNLPV